jgi:hypothetical protein
MVKRIMYFVIQSLKGVSPPSRKNFCTGGNVNLCGCALFGFLYITVALLFLLPFFRNMSFYRPLSQKLCNVHEWDLCKCVHFLFDDIGVLLLTKMTKELFL